jgi:chemotaxis signal transduction protein
VLVKAEIFSNTEGLGKMTFGFFVNEYLGTMDIETTKIKGFSKDGQREISGLVTFGTETICVLDIDNIFSREQLKELRSFTLVSGQFN